MNEEISRVPPKRQPSPGLKILQRSASEVALEDSIEAEGKFFQEAETLAVERGMPSPARSGMGSPDERDMSVASASSTHTAASVQAALASSQQLGGQPVEVSLHAKTPQKTPETNAKASAHSNKSSPRTPVGSGKKPSTPTSIASALSNTAPTPIRGQSSPNAASLGDVAPLNRTSPHPIREKGVTINEKENTAHSPVHRNLASEEVPALKPAGKNSAVLDDDVNALVQRAKSQASPRTDSAPDETVAQRPRPTSNADADIAKARARASYLLKQQDINKRAGDDDDDAMRSEYSSSSRSSLRSSRSVISECLRKSQEKGWSDKVTNSLGEGPNGMSAAQQALFLSMKRVTKGKGSRSSDGTESKYAGSESAYSDDGRASTAGSSIRSSKSGGQSSKSSTKMSSKEIAESLKKLTAPVRHIYTEEEKKQDPSLQFMLLEEAKECNRKPFKSKRWAESTAPLDDDGDEDAKGTGASKGFAFVSRMDTKERNRREDMQMKMAKKDYDARLDKKVCPQCGAAQSYDEVIHKRFKCSVCEIEFKPKLTWAKVSKKFEARNKEYAVKSKALHEATVRRIEEEQKPKHHAFNPATGKVEEVVAEPKKTRWDESMEKSFFDRMEEKLDLREERLHRVEENSFGKQCTFKPHIAKKKRGDDDEEDDEEGELTEEDKAQAFMMRYDADLEDRMKQHPEKYRAKTDYRDPKLKGKPTWN